MKTKNRRWWIEVGGRAKFHITRRSLRIIQLVLLLSDILYGISSFPMRTGNTAQSFSQYPTTFLTLDGMKRRLPIAKAPILRRPCPYRFYSSRAKDAAAPISTPPASPGTNVDSPSVKLRKWGNRALPLSPIMDPVKIEQRNRHRKTKLPPPKNADLTPFQKALVNNPYGKHKQYSLHIRRLTVYSPGLGHRHPPLQHHRRSSPIVLPNSLRSPPTHRSSASVLPGTHPFVRRCHPECFLQEDGSIELCTVSPICS